MVKFISSWLAGGIMYINSGTQGVIILFIFCEVTTVPKRSVLLVYMLIVSEDMFAPSPTQHIQLSAAITLHLNHPEKLDSYHCHQPCFAV
jgi:hypothetical protein